MISTRNLNHLELAGLVDVVSLALAIRHFERRLDPAEARTRAGRHRRRFRGLAIDFIAIAEVDAETHAAAGLN